jgi:hypothetical protein
MRTKPMRLSVWVVMARYHSWRGVLRRALDRTREPLDLLLAGEGVERQPAGHAVVVDDAHRGI